MSIKPPSDIVLDVARAADPSARATAMRRLAAASESAPQFAAALDSTRSPHVSQPPARASTPTRAPAQSLPKAMSTLEAFFLRTAFDTMLPAKGIAGTGSGIWKSMLAETLANQVVASGGLNLFPVNRT